MRAPSDKVEETTQINGSQGPLGASWGACGSLVELPWSLLRRAGSHLGAAWGHGGRSGGPLGALLGPLGALLGRAWGPWNPNGSEVKNVDFLLVFVRFGRSPPPGTPRGTPPAGDPGGRVGKGLPNRLRHWFQFDLFVVDSIFLSMSIEGDCRDRLRSISLSMSIDGEPRRLRFQIDVTTINSSHTPTSRRISYVEGMHSMLVDSY